VNLFRSNSCGDKVCDIEGEKVAKQFDERAESLTVKSIKTRRKKFEFWFYGEIYEACYDD
jgi:hypothetical protein